MAVGGTRQKLSMIATVTNQGKTRWMIIDEAFDAEKLIEFLQALIKDAGKKVFLILDNLRVHHSKLVKARVAERQEQIELFYLPKEQVTCGGQRSHGDAGATPRARDELLPGSPGALCRLRLNRAGENRGVGFCVASPPVSTPWSSASASMTKRFGRLYPAVGGG